MGKLVNTLVFQCHLSYKCAAGQISGSKPWLYPGILWELENTLMFDVLPYRSGIWILTPPPPPPGDSSR